METNTASLFLSSHFPQVKVLMVCVLNYSQFQLTLTPSVHILTYSICEYSDTNRFLQGGFASSHRPSGLQLLQNGNVAEHWWTGAVRDTCQLLEPVAAVRRSAL